MRGERGAGTLMMVTVLAVIASVIVLACLLIRVRVAASAVRSAADLGVLSGATALAWGEGEDTACAQAQRVVKANGAELTRCAAQGEDLVLTASLNLTVAGLSHQVTATARAGPS